MGSFCQPVEANSYHPIFDLLFQPPGPNGTMSGTKEKGPSVPDPKKGGGK